MEPHVTGSDQVRRFIFEDRPVRGHWVHLEQSWRELRAHAEYPAPVSELLGEAVAASLLLAATLKFRGTLTFQLQGNGAVPLLVAQCTHDFRLRAVARFEEEPVRRAAEFALGPARFRGLVGTEGRITVTIEAEEGGARYQGVVPLSGDSLAESLEAYFAASEQLPTTVVLAADAERVAGLLVQRLPGSAQAEDAEIDAAWAEAARDMQRIDPATILATEAEATLLQGFPTQVLRLFRGAPVRFECRCSVDRVSGVLKALGAGEVRDVLREQGAVTVTCEFCHRPYRFDAIDIEALFADTPSESPQSLH
ncbi:MAG: Hsp33 family molecular chaperone HslO [Gammaproteobacteria bacterium]|nr:Hsp33 family molecular chaperone HslO [Gammaproteobacteria bacterium]MBV9696914.1 Hsp33 family molecular chaperone HslO [Gammaproteobacteria bacterium]